MELIFEEKKKEYSAKLRQINRAIWLTIAIWLVGVCLFLLFSTRQNGFGRWGCTLFTVLFAVLLTYFLGLRKKETAAKSALFEKLDEGSVYREFLTFDTFLKSETVAGVLLTPCRFLESSGGDRKIYLPPQGILNVEKGQRVTAENTAGVLVSCRDRETGAELLSISDEPEKGVSVKEFLSRFALVLAGGTVAAVMLIGLLFSLLHSPKPNESVYVFFAGKVQSYSLERDSVREIADDGVTFVEISSAMPKDTAFMQKYSVVGLTQCNIIIVPLDIAEQTDVKNTDFEEFCGGAELPAQIADRVNFFARNGKNVGIRVDGLLKSKLEEYFVFDASADYIMFATRADFGGVPQDEGYAVGKFLEWLLE